MLFINQYLLIIAFANHLTQVEGKIQEQRMNHCHLLILTSPNICLESWQVSTNILMLLS